MRIIVTGATGFIGRWLVPRLQDAGHDVFALVRASADTAGLSQAGVPIIRDDGVRDLQADFSANGPFDGVIHLASLFLVTHKQEDVVPLLTSNIQFPARILDACVRSGVRWVVNTGTAWQHYEGHAYSPVNLYAATAGVQRSRNTMWKRTACVLSHWRWETRTGRGTCVPSS